MKLLNTPICLGILVIVVNCTTMVQAETINVGTVYRTGAVDNGYPEFLNSANASTRAWNFGDGATDQTLNGVLLDGPGNGYNNGLTFTDIYTEQKGTAYNWTGDPQEAAKNNISNTFAWYNDNDGFSLDISATQGTKYRIETLLPQWSVATLADIIVDGTLFADEVALTASPIQTVYEFDVVADADGIDITLQHEHSPPDGWNWVTLSALSVTAITAEVWDAGAGADTNWDGGTYANWDGDADPGLVEVQFGSAGSVATMNVSDTVESVTFNASGNFDIAAGGGILTINEGITTTTANNFGIAAPVTLGASQTFDVFDGSTLTISGAIDDGGNDYALTKTGAGTLTLTGTNTYSGGTTINGGTLAGNTTSLQGNITNNATVEFDQGTDGTYAGAMSGSGSLSKTGAGTLTLTGTNTYTGGTTINGGTLAGNTTSLQGNITNNAAVEFDQGTDGTYAGAMSGSGSLTKTGAGTLTLTGTNTYSGGTTVSVGTLVGNTTSLQGNITNNAAVEFDQSSGSGTYSGIMSGSGTLTKSGVYLLTLTGANTYSGGTILSAGGLTGSTTSLQGDIANNVSAQNGGVSFDQDTDGTYTGIMSGTGTLYKEGTGTVILTGMNTYSGGTDIYAGTLAVSDNANLGDVSGALRFDGGTLRWDAAFDSARDVTLNWDGGTFNVGAYDVELSGDINGFGSLSKTGAGTLTLTGTNTYSGGTTLDGGTLSLANSSALGTGGITVLGSTIDYADGLNIVNTIDLQNDVTLNVSTGSATQSGDIGETGGSWGITKTGAGRLILSGTLTYSGGTTVLGGTLVGNTTNLQGNITNNADIEFDQDTDETYAGAMSGSGSLTKSGTGSLTLSGTNTYSGGTTINGGTLIASGGNAIGDMGTVTIADVAGATLQLDADETIGGLSGGGEVNLQANTLTVGDASNTVFDGVISGPGSLTKSGTGTLTLTGTNTYTGGTTLSAGTLHLGSSGAIGSSGPITFTGGTLQYSSGNTIDYSGRFSTAAGQRYSIDTNGEDVTFTGNLTSSGGSLTKLGEGTLTLSGNNTYSAGTTLNAGTIILGTDGALGTGRLLLGGDAALQSNADARSVNNAIATDGNELAVSGASNLALGGVISGTGSLTKLGKGTLILTGTNTYTGGTALSAGTLHLGSSGAIGSSGTITFDGGTLQYSSGNTTDYSDRFSTDEGQEYTIDTNGEDVTFAGNLTSSGGSLTKLGEGALTLSGNNTYTGGTTLTKGTIILGTDAALGTGRLLLGGDAALQSNDDARSVSNAIATGGNELTVSGASNLALDGEVSGTGSLTKSGTGTLTLTGTNTYSGGTTINQGSLVISADGQLGSGAVTLDGGLLGIAGTSLANDSAISNTLAFTDNGGGFDIIDPGHTFTYDANLTHAGSLTKTGAGTLTLTGTNTYTGGTTINQGSLLISTDENLGFGDVTLDGGLLGIAGTSLANNGAISNPLTFTDNGGGFDIIDPGHTFTYDANLTHAGPLTKLGAGTLILTGTNTYTGGTTLSAGTLHLGSSRAIGSSGTITFTGGTLQYSASNTTDYSSRFSTSAGQRYTIDTNGEDITFAGNLTSSGGSLTKLGEGTLTLSGTNTYTGSTTLSAGALNLTGQLFGDVVVNGGTLMGTGTLANNGNLTVNSGASFAPGASIGTTTITGNYIQNSGSTLQIEVLRDTDYSLSSDFLAITGTATLESGSRINVTDLTPVDRFILTGDTFTIITAGGGVTDNGAAVTDTSAVLSFAGSVSGNDYILTATRKPFAPEAKSNNNAALLGTIDSDMSARSFTSDFTFINALSSLTTARLNNAAKQLSPVAHASSFLLSTNTNQHLSSGMSVYLRARRHNMPHLAMPDLLASSSDMLFADASANPALLGSVIRETQKRQQQAERAQRTGYFISPFGTYYTQDPTGNIEGFSAKSAGMHFGYDTSLNDHLILGIGGSYSYASIDYDHDLGKADVHSLRASTYGTYFKDDWFIDGSATLGYHTNSTDRNVQFGGIDRTPTATYDAHELSAYLRTGLDIHYNGWTLTPSTSMHYTYYRSQSFQERNAGSAGLSVDANTQQSLLGKLGVHLHRVSALADVKVVPELFVGYAHQFLDEGSVNARFVNGVTKFTTDIDSDRDNSVYYGAGLSVLLSDDVSAFVRYEGESYSGSKTNSVDLGLTMYL